MALLTFILMASLLLDLRLNEFLIRHEHLLSLLIVHVLVVLKRIDDLLSPEVAHKKLEGHGTVLFLLFDIFRWEISKECFEIWSGIFVQVSFATTFQRLLREFLRLAFVIILDFILILGVLRNRFSGRSVRLIRVQGFLLGSRPSTAICTACCKRSIIASLPWIKWYLQFLLAPKNLRIESTLLSTHHAFRPYRIVLRLEVRNSLVRLVALLVQWTICRAEVVLASYALSDALVSSSMTNQMTSSIIFWVKLPRSVSLLLVILHLKWLVSLRQCMNWVSITTISQVFKEELLSVFNVLISHLIVFIGSLRTYKTWKSLTI